MNALKNAADFPPSPASIPPGLADPTAAYRRHAWLALAGLLAFVAVYLGLTGYLAWSIYRLLGNALLHGGNVIGAFFLSLPAIFFFAFLIRGLFLVKHQDDDTRVQVDRASQPRLFAVLDRLADETKAPRPHRVFVSGRVNASVFYDLSFFNLILPSKKNLELGLGLVNTLSLDELKAVIAHEFGHFAQRSMAVGRWVYLAQQIAGHVVMSRGVFDSFLRRISNVDLRLAWIGWILRVFVWAIRALLDTVFRMVVLAHRALGREMEFQADKVAVSVSGSDSLVHALYRLSPADEAWERAASFAANEIRCGRACDDFLQFQSIALEQSRRILAEPEHGLTPSMGPRPAQHRVFAQELAQPPRMWLTHPPNREREDNAKAVYVPSPLDSRSAWSLFDDTAGLRKAVTGATFRSVEKLKEPPASPEGTAAERFVAGFNRPALDPRYRGVYLSRSIAAHDQAADAMFGPTLSLTADAARASFGRLYPPSLRTELAKYREHVEEESLLDGLAQGALTAPGGVIRYRGQSLRRKELPTIMATAKAERVQVEQEILKHDRLVRGTHLAAAKLLGKGWPEHLKGLVKLLHFSTHTARNVGDAFGHLQHVLEVAFADGRVSSGERQQIVVMADAVTRLMQKLWADKEQLVIPTDVSVAFEARGGWSALSQNLGLGTPSVENVGDWLDAAGGWVRGALADLNDLTAASLDVLLQTEAQVATAIYEGVSLEAAPIAATVPTAYELCCVGEERVRAERLSLWDKFQSADGFFSGVLRAAVAAALLLPALFVAGHVGESTVHIVNGLTVPVTVTLGGKTVEVAPFETEQVGLPGGSIRVAARLSSGAEIESFDAEVGAGFAHSVYNVAQASAFVEWTAAYGTAHEVPSRGLGAARWFDAPQDAVFTAPPTSVSLKAGQGATRTVLESLAKSTAQSQLHFAEGPDKVKLALAHLKFDSLSSSNLFAYSEALTGNAEAIATLESKAKPGAEVLAERALEIVLSPEDWKARCERLTSMAANEPDNANTAYLEIHCLSERAARPARYLEAFKKWPKHPWLNWAAADELARLNRFGEALAAFQVVLEDESMGASHDMAATEALRVERWAKASKQTLSKSRSARVKADGETLRFVRETEDGKNSPVPVVAAWQAMAKGDLAAVRVARARLKDQSQALTALAAASDGATEADVAAGLADLPQSAVDFAWAQAALAIRQGVEPTPYLASTLFPSDLKEKLKETLTLSARKQSVAQLAALAAPLELRVRAQVLGMGLIVFGKDAPDSWRELVKAGLFVFERPSFR